MATDHHAEHVGSLLRQPWLLDARAAYNRGELTEAGLREAEDRAVLENIALQREAGIQVFTDGEARRTHWMTGILESTGGMSRIETPLVTWRREDGEEPPAEETDFEMMAATDRVYRKAPLTSVEAEFMARRRRDRPRREGQASRRHRRDAHLPRQQPQRLHGPGRLRARG